MLLQGNNRHQMEMRSPDDCIAADNPVRLIDALVKKLDFAFVGVMRQITNK